MGTDGKVIFEVGLDTKSFDAQISDLENKLDTLEQEYDALKKASPYPGQQEDLIHYEKEIEKASNQIINLRKQQTKLEQTNSKSWGKILNNVKKVGLRMLGIASIYGIVSKASSSYLSKDTELAEKLQSVWFALGSFLAPVIEGISNILLKSVGYINEFIKALTGIDYIAKANAKAIEKQTKATKELNKANKQTYDFDVVRTQQETNSSSVSSGVSGLIDIPQLNQGVVDKLKDLAKWLKDNKELIEGVGIALVATFGAIAIAKIIGGIATLIGSGAMLTGLAGLAYLLGIIATAVLITIIIKGIDEALQKTKELNEALKQENDIAETNTQSIKDMTDSYWKLEEQGENNEKTNKLFIDSLQKTSENINENIDKIEKQRKAIFLSKEARISLTNTEKEYAKELAIVNGNYKKLYDQGKLNEEQKQKYSESLKKEIEITKDLKFDVSKLEEQYQKINGQTYTSKIDLDTSQAERKANSLWDSIKHSFGVAFETTGQGLKDVFRGLFGTKAYAAGGIVTQPTRAIIGEAGYPEAVVPMTQDYLSTLANEIARAGGGTGGGTTNVYLDGRLIQRQIANREEEIRFASNK